RSLISTFAPSLTNNSAVARPIPRAEPVMIALFPSSSPKVGAFRTRARDSATRFVKWVRPRILTHHQLQSGCGYEQLLICAVALPEAVGGDAMGDYPALGIRDPHLAEAEPP